jgi:hypothetical protein
MKTSPVNVSATVDLYKTLPENKIMNFFKKILILVIIVGAMYITYVIVQFLKLRIEARKNITNFLLLFFLSFAVVFFMIYLLGWIFGQYRNFFFNR